MGFYLVFIGCILGNGRNELDSQGEEEEGKETRMQGREEEGGETKIVEAEGRKDHTNSKDEIEEGNKKR